MSPKAYMIYNDETSESKRGAKGVPHNCELTLKHFKDKLYENKNHKVDIRSLRVLGGSMSKVFQTKQSLSDLFAKFRVSDDAITCTPLTLNDEYL